MTLAFAPAQPNPLTNDQLPAIDASGLDALLQRLMLDQNSISELSPATSPAIVINGDDDDDDDDDDDEDFFDDDDDEEWEDDDYEDDADDDEDDFEDDFDDDDDDDL